MAGHMRIVIRICFITTIINKKSGTFQDLATSRAA
jgi:hypothetical protein